ncbi:MAG: RNA recognition motif domain-containing protein [Ignavibacteria bacterium]
MTQIKKSPKWTGENKMNIYVGNISRELTDNDIRKAFEEFGEVASVNIIKDRMTGQSKGFGFVEMPNKEEAENAIKSLDGQRMNGRAINVAEARPRTENRRQERSGNRRRF